ncbi:DUF6438 domain-containing protein [Pseudocolwellia sp. HL-MZ19]|uniref:DUF6438 domain-containing protein n=1 Tax=Pseudocolwellia sp. HL-MZ19 TaxID=3400846 RepID=UPI003CF7D6FB
MNQQPLIYIALSAVLIVTAVFGYKVNQEADYQADIEKSLSTICCDISQLSNFKLTLERSRCYGSCPIFSLSISSNGSLVVKGEDYVDFKVAKSKLSTKQLTNVARLVFQSNYFEIPNIYERDGKGCNGTWTDNSTIKWGITIGRETHNIDYYKGCKGAPDSLNQLEKNLIVYIGMTDELL